MTTRITFDDAFFPVKFDFIKVINNHLNKIYLINNKIFILTYFFTSINTSNLNLQLHLPLSFLLKYFFPLGP